MFDSMKSLFERYTGGLNRRDLFRKGGLLALPGLLRGSRAAAAPADCGRAASRPRYLPVDRRPSPDQLPRHADCRRRVARTAGSALGEGCGGSALRSA